MLKRKKKQSHLIPQRGILNARENPPNTSVRQRTRQNMTKSRRNLELSVVKTAWIVG